MFSVSNHYFISIVTCEDSDATRRGRLSTETHVEGEMSDAEAKATSKMQQDDNGVQWVALIPFALTIWIRSQNRMEYFGNSNYI